jgi:hypothetical protein
MKKPRHPKATRLCWMSPLVHQDFIMPIFWAFM